MRYVPAQPVVGELIAALREDAHVVDDLAAGWKLKAAQPQSTIATRNGELITRSGLLLVGQDTGASLAVLTRQSELRSLDAQLVESTLKGAEAQGAGDGARTALE